MVMTPPAYFRERSWQIALAALLAAVLFAFHAPLSDMIHEWATKPDYSHGFFVAPFALYLLWTRREMLPRSADWPDGRGLVFIAIGIALSFLAGQYNYAKEITQGLGLILALSGVVVLMFGRYAIKWAWPGLAFLVFMLKMPDSFEVKFAWKLRQFASQSSNYILQTLGYPSYVGGSQGTVLTVNEHRFEVEWACSGLSMVLTFLAVAAAFSLLVQRPLLDRVILFASALPIAVACNVIRITSTALISLAGYQKLSNLIFHDLAGWLMMPAAMVSLWLEIKLLDWLFTTPAPPERDDIIKQSAQTAAAVWQMPPDGPQGAKR